MGIFDFLRKKPENFTTLTDADRESGLEIRRSHSEIKRLKEQIELEKQKIELEKLRQELTDLKDEYLPDEADESSGSSAIDQLLIGLLAGSLKPAAAAPAAAPAAAQELSETDIKAVMQQYLTPALIKQGKKLKDDDLKAIARKKFPQLSETELNKAVFVFRAL
jgi:hypothetical protein